MSLRTPSTTQTRQALLDLERTKERLATNQTRITSGKRLADPGDDPAAAAAILSFGTSIQANTQFIKQADSSISLLTATEDVVSATVSDVMRLMELAVSGSANSAPEVDSLKTNLIALGNTYEQGKYLFSGTKTQTPPFTSTPTGASYAGDKVSDPGSGAINLAIGASNSIASVIQVQTNVTGDKAFGGAGMPTDLFKTVTDLSNALKNPASVPSLATISTDLDAILSNLNQVLSDLGGRQASLLSMKDMLSGFNITLQGLQNAQQDTDYPQAMTEFTSDQTIQSVSLSAMAKSNKSNLFDYLG